MEEKKYKKPYNKDFKKPYKKYKKPYEKKEEKFDIDKWFKNNPTPIESPRGKKNTRKK